MRFAEDRQHRRIIEPDQLDLRLALGLLQVLHGCPLVIYVAVPGDPIQHLPDNGVGANRRLAAVASGGHTYVEALTVAAPLPKMRKKRRPQLGKRGLKLIGISELINFHF
jgi:hypothetical protein